MKYFELKCTAYLKKDITLKDSFEVISKYISYAMAQTQELKKLHNKKGCGLGEKNSFGGGFLLGKGIE